MNNTLSTHQPVSASRSVAPIRREGRELLLLSASVLFLELALIRWAGAQVRALAYFPNLLLIASFLGLGVGCLRAGKKDLGEWWMPSLGIVVALIIALGRVIFTQKSSEEHLWLLYYDLPKDSFVVHNIWLPVLLCFTAVALAFVSPGQLIAERLRRFKEHGASLRGYAWDLGGSFLGATLFSLFAFWRFSPVAWFGVALAAVAWLDRARPRRLAATVALGSAIIAAVHFTDSAERYSPYYGLRVVPGDRHASILANGALHQIPFDVDPATSTWQLAARGYNLPYERASHHPRHALVLGAGSGNDVATLLRQGALSVDAVEIDPVIIDLGREHHPNRPYADPRVTIYNTDARVFLNQATKHYDTIVFGTLDSMTKLSALSNVRLDNFVYTTDCFAAARRLLTDDGGMLLYFMAPGNFINARIEGMLAKVFGHSPAKIESHYGLFSVVYLAGPAFDHLDSGRRAVVDSFLADYHLQDMNLPDDDWPFLYLADRRLSSFYVNVLAAVALIAAAAVFAASREFRTRAFSSKGVDAPMFLYGFAFLLLETRSVTAMNLVWGTTWLTNAVVFGAILLTILAGTLFQTRRPLSLSLSTVGLAVCLLGLYFTPEHLLLGDSTLTRLLLSLLAVGLPVFFAASGFALLYDRRAEAGHAFGWNLLGAVAGGLAESLSMVVGLRSLLMLALAAYLLAYLRENANATPTTALVEPNTV